MRLLIWAFAWSLISALPTSPPSAQVSTLSSSSTNFLSHHFFRRQDDLPNNDGTGDTLPVCGAAGVHNHVKARAVHALWARNILTGGELFMRMKVPEEGNEKSIADFLIKNIPNPSVVYHSQVEFANTAVYIPFTQSFTHFSKADMSISLGAEGLCGCTLLVIVSRTGVYMAHYFENISWLPDSDYIAKYGTSSKAFDATVIQPLTFGAPSTDPANPNIPDQEPLATHVAGLPGAKAFIVYPISGVRSGVDPYKSRRNKLKTKINNIFQAQRANVDISLIPYDPDRSQEQLNTERGRTLLKWTPTENLKNPGAPPNLLKLWNERKEIFSDAW